jgi:hypothetical protein
VEESRRLVVEGTIRFPAEVNAIPEALGWDDGTTGSTNSTFPKIDSALHVLKDGSKISGRIRNLGQVSVINETITCHTKPFVGEGGLQVNTGALRAK